MAQTERGSWAEDQLSTLLGADERAQVRELVFTEKVLRKVGNGRAGTGLSIPSCNLPGRPHTGFQQAQSLDCAAVGDGEADGVILGLCPAPPPRTGSLWQSPKAAACPTPTPGLWCFDPNPLEKQHPPRQKTGGNKGAKFPVTKETTQHLKDSNSSLIALKPPYWFPPPLKTQAHTQIPSNHISLMSWEWRGARDSEFWGPQGVVAERVRILGVLFPRVPDLPFWNTGTVVCNAKKAKSSSAATTNR